MDAIAQKIIAQIDANRDTLIAFAKAIAAEAEPGFYEEHTAQKVTDFLKSCGLTPQTGLARTGVKAVFGTKKPCVCIVAELDGVACPTHPQANPANGLAHACGHHLQLTALAGAALALTNPAVAQALDGSVAFFAVPAEEYVRLETQAAVAKSDGIRFCCGKSELLRIHAFSDIDIALTTHVHMIETQADLLLGNNACNGFLCKSVVFHGKAAHAATAPHLGVNALNAAALSLSAIGMLRETFREKDSVRIHTNILHGGDALNVVPDTVALEAQLRAANLTALHSVSAAFDRACNGCAAALGAVAEIETHQGYMPVLPCAAHPASIAAADAIGENLNVLHADLSVQNMASTDVGDLTQVMPVINFTHSGVAGALHSAEFHVTDDEKAYLIPAKMMALQAYELLKNNAACAKKTIADFTPALTLDAYIKQIEEA
ncbi:MAG: amidohydrolase [Ruthenibacterium sp.]